MGEIRLQPAAGGFVLCHRDDSGNTELASTSGPEAARELAGCDDAGRFRPLKTAPTLRHGWRLKLANLAELRRALDYFYPAMLGVWRSHTCGELKPVPFRETLDRQTGMYRVAQKITAAQADALIGSFCRTDGGCLKRILWPLAPGVPITTLPAEKFQTMSAARTLPLFCHEACNLLVAKAREVVKMSKPE
jgi:sirohydrochlorin cobaltochelatase